MKKIVSCIAVALVCVLFASSALALTAEEFEKEGMTFFESKGKTPAPAEFLKRCNDVLKEAGDDTALQSMAYAMRSHAHWYLDKEKEALDDALKAVDLDSDNIWGYFMQLDPYMEQKNYEALLETLHKAQATTSESPIKKIIPELIRHVELRASTVAPAALWNEYNDNEVAADMKYSGKEVIIAGRIGNIYLNPFKQAVVSFYVDKHKLSKVDCVFPESAKQAVANLKKGQDIQIKGKVDKMTMKTLSIKNCAIVE